MPLIKPPSDYGLPEPQFLEETPVLSEREIWERNRRMEIILNVKPWKCPQCNLTNFGRNKHCARWTCKLPRPADFKLEPRDK